MSTSVSGLTTNFFPSPQNGFTTTTSGSVSSGATSVGLNSVAGYSNGQVATFVIDPTNTNKKQTFTGVIDTSGLQVTSVVWTAGTNQSHTLGATVVDYTTATHLQQMTKGILTHADQDGTLKAGAVDNAAVVASGILTADRSTAGANIETWRSEDVFDHIASGCVWSGDAYASTRNASCTSGVVYIAGKRLTVAAVTARSFTASKDVYCDLKDNGDGTAVWVYYDNTTNATSPSFATTGGTVRGAIIVVGASNIASAASVNQGQETMLVPIASSVPYAVTDSLGNLICPRDPNRKTLGYKQITSNFSIGSATATQITGLSCPVIVPTGRKVNITVYTPGLGHTTSGNISTVGIWDGVVASGTLLNTSTMYAPTNNISYTSICQSTTTPSSSSKTYNASLLSAFGNPSASFAGSATAPGYIKVELA